MENFKLATQKKIRVQTSKGLLSTEQLWDLSVSDLDALAVSLEEEYKKSGKKSFLVSKTEKDIELKLKFGVVLEILTAKVEEQERLAEAQRIKTHNAKIIAIIADKQDESLKGKSIKQLQDMLE